MVSLKKVYAPAFLAACIFEHRRKKERAKERRWPAGSSSTAFCHSAAGKSRSRAARIATQLPKKPCLRELPVAHHRLRRHAQRLGRLLHAEAAEEPHLDHLALPLV